MVTPECPEIREMQVLPVPPVRTELQE